MRTEKRTELFDYYFVSKIRACSQNIERISIKQKKTTTKIDGNSNMYIGNMSRCIFIIIGCIQANLSNQFELQNKTDKRNTYVCDSSQFRAHLIQFHSFFPPIHYEL